MKYSLIFMLVCLPLNGWTSEGEVPETEETEKAYSSSACPRLFGDEETREENRELREECLGKVRCCEFTIDLVHNCDFEEPEQTSYTGLELIGTIVEKDEQAVALFRIEEGFENLDCPSGTYALRVDDSIGEQCAILAILPDTVLIDEDGQLKFLLVEEAKEPVWRLIWRSGWKVLKMPSSSGSSGRRRRRRRTPRSRSKSRRRR